MCWTNDSISEPHDFPSITAGCVIITFAPHELRKEYNINITDDSWGEKEFKTFNIAIRNNDAAVTFNDTTSYNVTLHDDDNSFCTTKPLRFYEQTDKYVNITIRRIGEITTTNTSVRISTRPNKAITPEDYISLTDNKTLTFLVNEVEKTVSVKIINDKLTEDEQMFDLLLMGQNGSTVIPNCKTPPVIIVSNDVNIFCKQHAGVQQDFEDQTPVLITFTREGSTQYNHTIRIRTRSGTAQSGSDFLPIDKVLTFVSGQTRIEQNVTVVKDNNVEQDESFRLEVTSSDNRVNVLCPKIDFVIRNDDSKYSGIVIVSEEKRNVSFVLKRDGTKNKASPICVSEEKRNVSFVLKREGTKNKASPIWYSTVDGTAYDKADYKPVNQKNVTFQPGQEYMTLSVEIVNDQINEEDETFAVVIGSHVSTTLTSSPCTNITIKDKDLGEHAPHPLAAHAFGARCYVRTFEKKHATPLGFCNNIFFILQSAFHRSKRKPNIQRRAEADVRYRPVGSIQGKVAGVLKNGGEVDKTKHEVFGVNVWVLFLIHAYIYYCPYPQTSIKEDGGPYVVRLCRVGVLTANHTVELCRTTEANTEPSITAACDIITFSPNNVIKSHNIGIINDNKGEHEFKRFTISIKSNDSAVTFNGTTSYDVTLQDNDTYIYFCPPYKTYIREASGPYIVGLCRVGVTQESHTVELCWTNDSISEPHDFPSITAGCVIITFAPHELRKEYNINITDDSWGEKEFKTFNIAIRNNDAAVTFNDTTSYNVTLHDDDNSFCTTKPLRFYEQTDKYVNITIRRIGEITTTNTSVRITTRPNKAITPEDYISLTDNKTLTFLVNEVEKTVSVKIINDKLTEDEQMFDLLLMGQNGSTVIPNCETPPVIIVSNDVFLNRFFNILTFCFYRIRTRSGTAKSGSDFLPIDKVLTFVSGQTRIEQNVTVVKDNNVEQDESFRLEVTSSDNRVNVLCPKIDFVIRNDDTFVRCENSTISVSEETKKASFVLKREGTKNKASPIWYSTVDGTAYDKADYKPVNKKTVTFQPGQEYMTLSVEIVNDQVNEEDETFAVVIGSHVSTTLTSSPCTNITIKDKDLERISSKQAQELLKERRNSVVLFSVAIGLVIALLIVMLIIMSVLYRVLHR
ncbi:hypothetical protein QZH41_013370 [Actinostola sp. cb2023]|nr:hypothetical protein QZH41_013370 [Actinostola sp. cb2023]